MLVGLAVWDIRYRQMPLWVLLLILAASVICKGIVRDVSFTLAVMGGAVGLCFMGISAATNESFGYADSILIFILGIYMGVWNVLYLLAMAFLLAAVYAGIKLSLHRFGRKVSIPFIPFLALGYMGVMFLP